MQDNIQISSSTVMPKVVDSGDGSITAPEATSVNSPQSNTVTIPHQFGTTDFIIAAFAVINYGGITDKVLVPWISNDGRIAVDAYHDSSNIYIRASSSTAGSSQPATAMTYTYNIIML